MAGAVRVLVVEDTEHVRRMLASMLELDGFVVVGALATGDEAVQTVDALDPDVVVCDYKMPGMDGLATARAIRAQRPAQPIILYTAFIDHELEQEAERAGIVLCLGKVEGLTSLEREIRRLSGSLL